MSDGEGTKADFVLSQKFSTQLPLLYNTDAKYNLIFEWFTVNKQFCNFSLFHDTSFGQK